MMEKKKKWEGKAFVRFSRAVATHSSNVGVEAEPARVNYLGKIDTDSVEVIREGKSNVFEYERCFDESSNNHQVYVEAIEPLLRQCLQGIHGTVLTYGVSSSVKNHTIFGLFPDDPGVVDHSVNFLLRQNVHLKVSILHIYNERIYDLFQLEHEQLQIRENRDLGIYIPNITENVVNSIEEFRSFMEIVSYNSMMFHSRINMPPFGTSYLFRFVLENIPFSNSPKFPTLINFAITQGAERRCKTSLVGLDRGEISRIGFSLSAFGNVLAALTDPRSHFVPYRDSKLTRLLTDTLEYGATSGIFCVDLNSIFDEQLSTLRYANRVARSGPISNKNWRRRKHFLLFLYQFGFRRLSVQNGNQGTQNGDSTGNGDNDAIPSSFSSSSSHHFHPIFDNEDICRFMISYL